MIHRWVELGDVPAATMGADDDKLKAARIFWINGPGSAGTGKSTIAYTIAQDLDERQKLGASFFCSRDKEDCCNSKLIFPTIAYQLGQFYPPLQEQISTVLKAHPETAFLSVYRQLERLLVKPLLAMQGQMPFCVVVIDALDECQNGGAASTILSSLAQYITALSPVKFFITSRPDAPIVHEFTLGRLSQTVQRCILHHVEHKVVETDLLLYLHSSLQKGQKHVQSGWFYSCLSHLVLLAHRDLDNNVDHRANKVYNQQKPSPPSSHHVPVARDNHNGRQECQQHADQRHKECGRHLEWDGGSCL